MREASEDASRIAKKLEVERQEKRDISLVRQARKDRADLVKDLTVVKSLQSEFEKAGNRRSRQVEISEKQARAEQDCPPFIRTVSRDDSTASDLTGQLPVESRRE
jgi:hypothetical protein